MREVHVQFIPEYNALLDAHKDLCSALPITELFPSLITLRVISIVDKEKLCLGRIEQERTEEFLEKYLFRQLAAGETGKFYNFMTILKDSEKCQFLFTGIG